MSASRAGLTLALLCLFPVVGCRCSDNHLVSKDVCIGVDLLEPGHPDSCGLNSECGDHYACSAVKDRPNLTCCVFADRKCTTEADCCPGETCPADIKTCHDKWLSCNIDADCGDKGDQVCEVFDDHYATPGTVEKRCRFKVCAALGDCPAGQSCFQGECLADLPCGGSCEAGKACVPSINRCQDYTTPTGRTEAACPMSCAPGFIATFKDSRNIWDGCNLPEVKCVCAELPGLSSEDLGRFSAIAADPAKNEVLVSAYDGQYGDLVVLRYGADGQMVRRDYVDGVPAGIAKYGPSGSRGGIVDPGDDVGRYTDVAVKGDKAFVSYYDVTHGDLKLASRGPDGTWATYRIDGASGDLGLYTSIDIDSDGYPGISYFQRAGNSGFDASSCPGSVAAVDKKYITALKFARATSSSPGASEWNIKTLDCQARPPPVCDGCTQVCANAGAGASCYPATTGCIGCASTDTCVSVSGIPACAAKFNPPDLNDLIDGTGLFTALTFKGKDANIVFQQRVPVTGKPGVYRGQLAGIHIGAQGTVGPVHLLDTDGDTGYFPDIKVEPGTGKLGVSYHSYSSRKLKYLYTPDLGATATPEVIDPGTGPTGSGQSAWVGTDSSLVFGPTAGDVFVVYQDATNGDLKFAQRSPTWKLLPALRTEGAVGFFADAALQGKTLFVSHARIHAKLVAGDPHVDNTLILERHPLP